MEKSETTFPHVPAAFINAIADEGTRYEAIEWLQKTWNERCALSAQVRELREEISDLPRSIGHYLNVLIARDTGRDPKINGFSYAEVPDWMLKQWIEAIGRDGTCLILSVRDCKPRERVVEKRGYTSLIYDTFYEDMKSPPPSAPREPK